jgi:hypothetical protein
LLGVVGCTFWVQDWRYSLPTPRPAGLHQAPIGAAVSLAALPLDTSAQTKSKPLFFHFFNPSCPCSRFNLQHVRELVRQHNEDVRFVAVLQGTNAAELKKSFAATGLNIEAVTDIDGRIARKMGVYSTPQAVLLSADGHLIYRGNYNLSRYCITRKTEYARIALEAYLSGKKVPISRPATISFGCVLPTGNLAR